MKKHLPTQGFTRNGIFLLPLCTLIFICSSQAQTITEGFEETAWQGVTTSSNGGNYTGGNVQVSSYSTTGTGSTYNTGTWYYSSGHLVTANTGTQSRTYTTLTGNYAFHVGASSSAYLATPLITNGVTSITFWVRTASTTAAFNIYAATNTAITSSNGSMSATSTAATGWYNSSGYTVNSTLGWASVSYQVTGPATNNPAYLKIQRTSSEMSIDDIVITTPAVMPVTIGSVKAYQKGAGIQVDWVNHTESNVSKYELEKSVDGSHFNGIASLMPVNNNGKAGYSWLDAAPVAGGNYYRIKTISNSGNFEFTQVVKVNTVKGNSSISLYPNPIKGNILNVQFNNLVKGSWQIQLFDEMGRQLFSSLAVHDGGSACRSFQLGKALRNGVYRLVVSNGESKFTQQVVTE